MTRKSWDMEILDMVAFAVFMLTFIALAWFCFGVVVGLFADGYRLVTP